MSGIAGTLEVVKDAAALAQRVADLIEGRLRVAQYPFRLVLSGGSTPRAASHRGESVILGASNRPRQADGEPT